MNQSAREARVELAEVEAALEAIRQAVRRRAGYRSAAEVPALDDVSPVVAAAQRARVSSHVVLASELPVVGGVIVFVQRAMRILLRWYINPIVDQQNAFNDAVVRALTELEARQRRLERLVASAESADAAE